MKFSRLGLLALISLSVGLVSCNSTGSDSKVTVRIQFVPSRDATDLATEADALEPILAKYAPDYDFDITTGVNYGAVTTALITDQIEFGFLTAQQYAEATIKYPGKVDVVLTSVRSGYAVQQDFPEIAGTDDEKLALQVKAMNGGLNGQYGIPEDYVYEGQQSSKNVTYYNSLAFALKDSVRTAHDLPALDANGNGSVELSELAGHVVALQNQSSGSGFIYPSVLAYNAGYTFKKVQNISDTAGLGATEIGYIDASVGGHDGGTLAVLNGQADAAFTFMDNRYTSQFSKGDEADAGKWDLGGSHVFENTTAIAMTTGIYNDTISTRSNIAPAIREAVAAAFKQAINDPEGKEILNDVYSHTGYLDAKDSDYDGERDVWQWKQDNIA